jgi:glutamate-ammonia-ligase adenylyltransferase
MDTDDALAFSHYARRVVAARPALRDELDATVERPFDWDAARAAIDVIVAAPDAAARLGPALRDLRARVMLHTLVRDLTGRASLTEVCGAVTTLAELAVDAAVVVGRRELVAVHGEPLGPRAASPSRSSSSRWASSAAPSST